MYRRVPQQCLLHVARKDHPAADDHALRPAPQQRVVAFLVHHPHVAGVQPAITDNTVGFLRHFPIPQHHVVTNEQFPWFTHRHFFTTLIRHHGLAVGQTRADGEKSLTFFLARVTQCHEAAQLRLTVGFDDVYPEFIIIGQLDIRGQRRPAGDAAYQRARFPAPLTRFLQQISQHQRVTREKGHPALLHFFPNSPGLPFLAHPYRHSPMHPRQQVGYQVEGTGERGNPQRDIRAGKVQSFSDGVGCPGGIAVRQQRAFGWPRGTGGVG